MVCVCVCVCVFERGRVCDVMSSGCVTTRKSVVRLVTAGCERCVWVCNVDTRLVDLGRLATWKVDLESKKVGHSCCRGYGFNSHAVSNVLCACDWGMAWIFKCTRIYLEYYLFVLVKIMLKYTFQLYLSSQWKIPYSHKFQFIPMESFRLWKFPEFCNPTPTKSIINPSCLCLNLWIIWFISTPLAVSSCRSISFKKVNEHFKILFYQDGSKLKSGCVHCLVTGFWNYQSCKEDKDTCMVDEGTSSFECWNWRLIHLSLCSLPSLTWSLLWQTLCLVIPWWSCIQRGCSLNLWQISLHCNPKTLK